MRGAWGQWTNQLSPVEGFSSPLWLALLYLIAASGLPLIVSVKLLGLGCAALTLLILWLTVMRLCRSVRLADLALLGMSLSAGFYFWASSGLETPLYGLLWISLCFLVLTRPQHYLTFALLALLMLARPEGVFLMPLLLVLLIVVARYRHIPINRLAIFLLLGFAIVGLSLRWHYYGLLLPNTYYAKASGALLPQIMMGLFYAIPLICIAAVLLLLAWRLREPTLSILLALLASLAAFVVGGGGDWMFHYRLWQPLLPMLIVSICYGWYCLGLQETSANKGLKLCLLLSLLPLLLFSVRPADILAASQAQRLPLEQYQEGTMTQQSLVLAEQMRDYIGQHGLLSQHGPQLIAVNHAGALPAALIEHNFIDMVGLNDATIAASPGQLHAKYNIDYVLSSQPDFVVLNTRVAPGTDGIFYHKGYWQGEDALVDDPRFLANYQPTELQVSWQWQIPWPMSMVYDGHPQSWIVVYQRRATVN